MSNYLLISRPEYVSQFLPAGTFLDPNDRCLDLSTPTCQAVRLAVFDWQNQYNSLIIEVVTNNDNSWNNLPNMHDDISFILKRLIMNESQFMFGLVTGAEQGTGLGQVTPDTKNTLINAGYLDPNRNYDLFSPQDNIIVSSANIRYLYDNLQNQSSTNGWNVYEEDILKISIALYNTGPEMILLQAIE